MRQISPAPAPSAPLLGRRGLLAGGAGTAVALLTGCSLNNPYNHDKAPVAEVVRDLEPDVAIAVDAVARIRAAQDAVGVALEHSPDLRPRLAGLDKAYQAYLDALLGAVPDGVDTTPGPLSNDALPTTRAEAFGQARSGAVGLRTVLTGHALRAESGPFARLLATMTAGLSQQLEVLAR